MAASTIIIYMLNFWPRNSTSRFTALLFEAATQISIIGIYWLEYIHTMEYYTVFKKQREQDLYVML